jgi:hypothetical protein
MDAKTMLLLGIGMAVLLLLGFCVAPSRSAALPAAHQLPSRLGATPGEPQAWRFGRNRQPRDQLFKTSSRFFDSVEHQAMLVSLEG